MRVISEEAKGPSDLPEGAYVCIRPITDVRWSIYFSDENGNPNAGPLRGAVDLIQLLETPGEPWMVRMSYAPHGWGPMLYDLALEFAGNRGVRPDMQVSQDAEAVWDYYEKHRPDVEVGVGYRDDWDWDGFKVYYKRTESVTNALERMGRLID